MTGAAICVAGNHDIKMYEEIERARGAKSLTVCKSLSIN